MQPEYTAPDHPLGALVDSFHWSRSSANLTLYTSLFLLPIAILFSLLIIGIPFFILLLVSIVSSIVRLRTGTVLFFYEQGLVDQRSRKHRIVPYTDITALRTSITQYTYFGTRYSYTLELSDRTKLVISDDVQRIQQISELLEDVIVRQTMPGAIATLRAGLPIEFGKLKLTPQGLATAKKMLPWSELETIEITAGQHWAHLSIYADRNGRRHRWKFFNLNTVPNLALLFALIDLTQTSPQHSGS